MIKPESQINMRINMKINMFIVARVVVVQMMTMMTGKERRGGYPVMVLVVVTLGV